jgi:hypothetical protein
MKKLMMILMVAILAASCTQNEMARKYGGTQTIQLDKGERVVTASWKEANLWILTKQDTTKPSVYRYTEKSSFGVMEGTIIIQEN